METNTPTSKIHPLAAAAAIAVIVASMAGIAAMTGLLPNFSKPAVPANASTTSDQASAPAVASANNSSPTNESTEAATQPAKPIYHKKTYGESNQQAYSNHNQVSQANQPAQFMAPPPCPNCGVVEVARPIQEQAPDSGLGAAAGALLGGVLGHQVGGGNGKTLATIAGAVGGGLAGNAVEKNVHTSTSYEVIVRMEDGSKQRFMMKEQRWNNGDLVRVDNGNLVSRN